MAGYHAMLAARVFDHAVVERMAAASSRAGRQHAQRSQSSAAGARRRADDAAGASARSTASTVAYVGDYNNVARSLAEACVHARRARPSRVPARATTRRDAELARLDVLGAGTVRAVAPTRPPPCRAPTSCTPTRGPRWVKRPRRHDAAEVFGRYQVNAALMAQAAADAWLHALPARVPRPRGQSPT